MAACKLTVKVEPSIGVRAPGLQIPGSQDASIHRFGWQKLHHMVKH